MTPIQQLLLGVGAKKKTYVDDVFSTYLYKGNASTLSINNGLNLSGEGGMTWIKARSNGTYVPHLYDTVRGAGKALYSSHTSAESTSSTKLTAFNSNGFSLGAESDVNDSGHTYASWTFRKAPGFFDVVTYTGNGTAGRTVAHSLGCVPGCIMIKRLDASASWKVYHRSTGAEKALALDTNDAAVDSDNYWNDTEPTASVFTLKQNTHLNANGGTYVAYLFAGGPSDSVDFDGTGDYITAGGHTDYGMGTGDFTIECWVKFDDSANRGVFQISSTGISSSGGGGDGLAFAHNGSYWHIYANGTSYNSSSVTRTVGKWYHVAMCRSSGVTKVFVDGSQTHSFDDTTNYNGTKVSIGGYYSSNFLLKGNVSNFRVVKGTALYTSAFTPPTAALTAITNTKLLCCNTSSVTGSIVDVSQQILSSGDPQASSDYPSSFVDSKVFGDAGDQNVIKCGSYQGSDSDYPEINLGFEPQWVLIKRTSDTGNWLLFDSMRGVVSGANDSVLYPDGSFAESDATNYIQLTPTGFKFEVNNDTTANNAGDTYVYMAIRRPDGYVGKPAKLGTDVFAMDTGAGNSTTPNFDSGFPVDFAFSRDVDTVDNWYTFARLTGKGFMYLQAAGTESDSNDWSWDSNVGWQQANWGSDKQSWMFKRHAGMDCITYKGDGVTGKQIPHSLSKIPEMIWIKNSDRTEPWRVYHKGLNGGTTPHNYGVKIDTNDAESAVTIWNQTAPTSTHFTINADSGVNHSGEDMRAFLFASVDGISKVGYYTGNGSATERTITLGFQPRFLIIKRTDTSGYWHVYDTLRGWGSGNDADIYLNDADGNASSNDRGAPTSTGFTLNTDVAGINASSGKYIYYAHA